ncbi:MAG: Aspartate-semialdehyde dehydrogenase [uncultured Rubrobacteraceae bacterium]|uniref:Aspartate-semialdehyde dehydrogenase n=1 Tax=uncultured Rubrobacteraceae bacterium TaxID=349277 RepID=A0A6J4PQN3_9ACTN|nr:MAG: Aspartate-semialdehyde dehydrogenase [uncultured Rubrobacteraceae bacterium]
MPEGYTVAVVGAGLVGERLVAELRRRNFPLKEIRVLARSARRATLAGETFEVGVAEPEAFEGVDLALFAGTEGEKGAAVQLAREAISRGAIVIDNGSDFRLDPEVPLVVPEVNAEALEAHRGVVANPNCSTIQLVVTLAPLAREFGLKKVVVSTYQAVSGAGRGGVEALENGREDAFPKPIVGNAIPLIGGVGEDGYTTEEKKMKEESRKILSLPDLPVFPTAVRIPVHTGHSESVYVETEKDVDLAGVLEVLGGAPGVSFSGDAADYPTPLEAAGDPKVSVGRVRVEGNAIEYWCVSDNLLKGAATNAVQIAEYLAGARSSVPSASGVPVARA